MRLTVKRGDHEVTIEMDGATPQLLRQAERTALQLLGDTGDKLATAPFGFQGRTAKRDA